MLLNDLEVNNGFLVKLLKIAVPLILITAPLLFYFSFPTPATDIAILQFENETGLSVDSLEFFFAAQQYSIKPSAEESKVLELRIELAKKLPATEGWIWLYSDGISKDWKTGPLKEPIPDGIHYFKLKGGLLDYQKIKR